NPSVEPTMDCRLTRSREGTSKTTDRPNRLWRRVGRWSVVFAPLLVVGCFPQSATLPTASPTARKETTTLEDQAKLPRRQPSPGRLVAMGKLREDQADEPATPGHERAVLRDEARRAYQQALKIDPNDVSSARALAGLYVKDGDYDRALATLHKVLKAHPQDAALWHDLAMIQARHREFDAALQSMYRALQLDPENRVYATTYGHLLARAERYDDAVTQFPPLLGPAMACYQVARMQQHMQRPDLARVYLTRSLQIEPNLEPAQQLLAALESGAA